MQFSEVDAVSVPSVSEIFLTLVTEYVRVPSLVVSVILSPALSVWIFSK